MMRKLATQTLVMFLALAMIFTLVACTGSDTVPEDIPESKIKEEPTPEPTPEPEPTEFIFPYSFLAEDLQGNPVTEETLGNKEIFLIYLWAVW